MRLSRTVLPTVLLALTAVTSPAHSDTPAFVPSVTAELRPGEDLSLRQAAVLNYQTCIQGAALGATTSSLGGSDVYRREAQRCAEARDQAMAQQADLSDAERVLATAIGDQFIGAERSLATARRLQRLAEQQRHDALAAADAKEQRIAAILAAVERYVEARNRHLATAIGDQFTGAERADHGDQPAVREAHQALIELLLSDPRPLTLPNPGEHSDPDTSNKSPTDHQAP